MSSHTIIIHSLSATNQMVKWLAFHESGGVRDLALPIISESVL